MERNKAIQELDDSLKNQHCGFVDGVGDVYAVSGETIKNIIALLKEQEAVEPTCTYNLPHCGKCGKQIPILAGIESNYCISCGQAVKWNEA